MERAKKGSGAYNKLPNGTIELTISVGYTSDGKRDRRKFYGKTESECRKQYKKFLKEGEEKPNTAKEYTLSEWLDEWLATYKQGKVQSSTYDEYVGLAKHIKGHKIGSMLLTDVKSMHVTEFFKSINHYSHSVCKRVKFILNGVFDSAVNNDLCSKNSVKNAEITKKPAKPKEPFTEDETREILKFAESDEKFGLPIYIMFYTGVRSGEIRALTTDKIDFEKGIITIDTAVKRNGELGLPKSNKVRFVPIKPEVAEYLRFKLNKQAKYIVGDNYYVSEAGFRSRYLWFFNRLNAMLKSMNKNCIHPKPPHTTRRTYGTLLHKHGMPMAIVKELMGHHSTDVTDKYVNLSNVTALSQAVQEYDLLNL